MSITFIHVRFLLCYAFILCVWNANAQNKYTVLLNNKQSNTLDFSFKNPLDTNYVKLTDVKLCMGIKTNTLKNIPNNVNFYLTSGTILGTKRLDPSYKKGNAFCILNHKDILSGSIDQISMTGRFTEKIPNVTFYGSNTSTYLDSLNQTPRLLMQYAVNREPYGTSWSQLSGNAQHNRQSTWRSASSSNTKDISEIRKVIKSPSGVQYITAYKGKVVVIKDGVITMLTNDKNNTPIWSLNLSNQPDKQPVITQEGLMIFVSKQKSIEVFDLNNGTSVKSIPFKECKWKIDNQKEVKLSDVNSEITLGYDGTLYMAISLEQSPYGIVALTAYPDFKPRWVYKTPNMVGQVSLSADERLVFFIEKTGDKSKLNVIENINGQLAGASDPILGGFKNDQMTYIPSVTLQTKGDTTIVYALDGNTMSNRLLVFKTSYQALVDGDGNLKTTSSTPLKLHQEINSVNTNTNTGLSHPTVISSDEVLMYKDKKIIRYNHTNNTFKDISGVREDINVHDLSIMAQQVKGHFYIITKNKILFKKTKEDTNLEYLDYVSASDIKSTVLNPDMSFFVLSNDGAVNHYFPVPADDKLYLDVQNKIQNRTSYLAKNVSIGAVEIKNDFQGTISAEQKIAFGKGFRVKKGAVLTFQSTY
jgi:hypothetical protein